MLPINEVKRNDTDRKSFGFSRSPEQLKSYKLIFSLGDYDVYMKKFFNELEVSVSHEEQEIGYFSFEKSEKFPGYFIGSAKIKYEYQGLGIGPRLYEGFIKNIPNFTLIGTDQSIGAMKAWKKLSTFPNINIYRMFNNNKDEYDFNPEHFNYELYDFSDIKLYRKAHALIAVQKSSQIDSWIKRHIKLFTRLDKNLKTLPKVNLKSIL